MQLFLSDPETKFSKSIGWNMGDRTARYAMIIDQGKVVYAEKEPGREVTVSLPDSSCPAGHSPSHPSHIGRKYLLRAHEAKAGATPLFVQCLLTLS